jgi:ABC-type phosphate transport system auxiliary subunit
VSETMTAVTDETAAVGSKPADVVGEQLARQLVEQARTRGVDLVGPDGLLRRVTKLVLEGGDCQVFGSGTETVVGSVPSGRSQCGTLHAGVPPT